MSIFARYQDRFEASQEEEMSVQEYLELCKKDQSAYATVAERMLMATMACSRTLGLAW